MKKVLIANRSDTALRILRTCQEMGLKTVLAHSQADADSMPVRLADESVCIGPAPARQSYLNMHAILSAAEVSGADAIHPGIGFLAENGDFARAVEEHGFTFIGPRPEHLDVMGDKITAKKAAVDLGLPTVPGSDGEITSLEDARGVAEKTGYPLLIKASGGGGGRGMRVVTDSSQLEEALALTRSEAGAQFGNDSVYIEKLLINPRHIEVQMIGDSHSNVCHLFERECSLQRSHQKVWEEAPAPRLSDQERTSLVNVCVRAMKKMGYQSVGTLEFLYEDGRDGKPGTFYFIEMNTRLQVEHTITEMVTGVDIVREQIRIAQGLPLSFAQDDITLNGHAIECRINAEDPQTFCPSPGMITDYLAPGGLGVRTESALYTGMKIPPYYDSLVSKLICWGPDRDIALARTRRALDEYAIAGVKTLLPLHRTLAAHPDVISGAYSIQWLEAYLKSERSES